MVGVQVVGCFGEDVVGIGFDIGDGMFDGFVYVVYLDGVGMCDQEEVWVGFGIGGSFYVVDYFIL